MTEIPFTEIENLADKATRLHPFRVNLRKVREQVSTMLSEWKSSGVFQEYTDHSFLHVVEMLKTAEWIIPESTKCIMTDGDWLMLVLATYFHDLGLLVSKKEFANRSNNPEFQSFKANPVLPTDKHKEYSARLGQLPPQEADRIQYQEFVRANHGKRIRAWIEGSGTDDEGSTAEIKSIVINLLNDLDSTFRSDLALVCESHTLGHADALAELDVSVPYGGGHAAEVNLRYIAVILRTIDLIQITHKRAPSVLYQIVSPSNPTSQVEWQKQGAVRDVRPSPAVDADGVASIEGRSNAIQVFATFKEPNGFFGLTTYVSYANKELAASYALVAKSKREVIGSYDFPWEKIDDRGIKADGFMTKSFQFNLDQRRILDLLTGHTLYNNSTVVLRELTQNALDAVRLQRSFKQESDYTGHVRVKWDSIEKTLIVEDTGTGMSQEIIERHLLTVGSSRYQDPEFLDKNPTFHSISRFGIGVLSTFMVSDDVEITTCSIEEQKARRIALQSVHGKYLIKLLDKEKDRIEIPVYPHGTSVKVKLRPTADFEDVASILRSWIMFPRCNVTVQVDDQEPISIGFESPKEAIESYLEHLKGGRSKTQYRVEEYSDGGVTLAFALSKNDFFQDWGFVVVQRGKRYGLDSGVQIPTATCIEGVAVEQNTPGFQGAGILAVANAVGKGAPKTNVARSAIEDTIEHRNMAETLYKLYGKHIVSEIERLAGVQGNSLTRAVGYAPYMMSPLSTYSNLPSKSDLLNDALNSIPIVLVEQSGERTNISLTKLAENAPFITIESPLNRSIEDFIKEAPNNLTTKKLMDVLGNSGSKSPSGQVLCNQASFYIQNQINMAFDVVRVEASAESRTLTLQWNVKDIDNPRWFDQDDIFGYILEIDQQMFHQFSEARSRIANGSGARSFAGDLMVPIRDVQTINIEELGGFVAGGARYLKPNTELTNYLFGMYNETSESSKMKLAASLLFLEAIRANGWSWDIVTPEVGARIVSATNFTPFRSLIDIGEITRVLSQTKPGFFDSFAWDRRADEESL